MPVRKIRKFLEAAEEFIEDFILILLSITVIILSVSAITVLTTSIPSKVAQRTETIMKLLPTLNFLAKMEYFAALVFPWVVMLIGLLLFRELWFLRRSIERIEFRKLLEVRRTEETKRKSGKR